MSPSQKTAAEYVPDSYDLATLADAVQRCRGCELWDGPERAVFGEGPADARMILVGEVPGDQEDRAGRPFVGPAGKLLDRALQQAGIDRSITYVTNAVKHFRFTERGKRRIHQTPEMVHVNACRPWLAAEMSQISPEVIVTLGATAGRALFGSSFRVMKERGSLRPFEPPSAFEDAGVHSTWTVATVHPSAILRMPDDVRSKAFEEFVADLEVARKALA
jgi:DNA polymerase